MKEIDSFKVEAALYHGFEPLEFDELPLGNKLADVETLDGCFYVCTGEQIVALIDAVKPRPCIGDARGCVVE